MSSRKRRITHRQKQVADAIVAMTEAAGGVPPTYEELAERVGVSRPAVYDRLKGLRDLEVVSVDSRASRALRVDAERLADVVALGVVGRAVGGEVVE